MDSAAQVYKPKFDFAYYLKKTQVEKDKALFSAWADGLISTQDCIYKWARNNNVDEDEIDIYKISVLEFEGWLNYMGYFRKQYY